MMTGMQMMGMFLMMMTLMTMMPTMMMMSIMMIGAPFPAQAGESAALGLLGSSENFHH